MLDTRVSINDSLPFNVQDTSSPNECQLYYNIIDTHAKENASILWQKDSHGMCRHFAFLQRSPATIFAKHNGEVTKLAGVKSVYDHYFIATEPI